MDQTGVSHFLQKLASQGTVESEGVFTIGWERAVEKLRSFSAGEADAFLLYLVSAGCAYGARNITIEDTDACLSVTMHATYVSEQDIQRGFNSIAIGRADNDALDLGMGLHGGLRGTVGRVELSAHHPEQPCFRWKLTPTSEKAVPEPAALREPRVTVTFQRAARRLAPADLWEKLFGSRDRANGLGGYVGLSRPCQIVDSRCDRCAIPISINSQLVTRPLNLPRAPIGAASGSIRGLRFHCVRVLELDNRPWQGGLVYQSGPLHIVVNGVSYPALSHPSVSGTVWTTLNRDLSRQRIVEDERFAELMRDLEEVGELMERAEAELVGRV